MCPALQAYLYLLPKFSFFPCWTNKKFHFFNCWRILCCTSQVLYVLSKKIYKTNYQCCIKIVLNVEMSYGGTQRVFPHPLFTLSFRRHPPHIRSIFSRPKTTPAKLKKNISSKSQFFKALKGMLKMKIFIFLS